MAEMQMQTFIMMGKRFFSFLLVSCMSVTVLFFFSSFVFDISVWMYSTVDASEGISRKVNENETGNLADSNQTTAANE